jgi:hypothetical protein
VQALADEWRDEFRAISRRTFHAAGIFRSREEPRGNTAPAAPKSADFVAPAHVSKGLVAIDSRERISRL